MNRPEQLYNNLMRLVESNEAFYYVDHVLNGFTYRVFTYRLASYTDFLEPDALESRGHMFRLNFNGQMEELVSLPFEKFFNLNENPFTMNLDLSEVKFIHDKRDGSLISTFMHDGMLCLKSKTAIASDQALDAMNLLNNDSRFHRLRMLLERSVNEGWTVIMEYTSPTNRIVLPYQTPELRVLAVRDNKTLAYADYDDVYYEFGEYMVDDHTHTVDDPVDFVSKIPSMTGIEGFVIGLPSGQRIKIKTDAYIALHRTKDSIQTDKNLFEVCLTGASDDVRSLFHDDPYTLDRIANMEKIVNHAYNHTVKTVEDYYAQNKTLDRKSYAVKGQQEMSRMEFNLAMMKYTGKEPDYKDMIMKNYEVFLK